jgi:drug/metabolite transporter (DMT)-like permease
MQQNQPRTMGILEWLLLILLSILWGGSFFFSKVAVAELPPLTLVLCRVSISAIALNLYVVFTGQRMPFSGKTWVGFIVLGMLNNLIPFSLIFWGQTQIPSGLASILNASTPVWAVLLAHFFTKGEHLTANRTAGVLLGLSGVIIMLGPDLLQTLGLNLLAQLAVVGAGVSYAFGGFFGERIKGIPPLITATGQVTCSSILMVPIVLLIDKPWQISLPGLTTLGAVLALALLSTAVAYLIYFRLLTSSGATNLMLVTLLIPVSALLLGIIILGERLDPRHFLGMGFIGLGLAAIDGRLFPLLRKKLLPASH